MAQASRYLFSPAGQILRVSALVSPGSSMSASVVSWVVFRQGGNACIYACNPEFPEAMHKYVEHEKGGICLSDERKVE